jgi:hypothetical protein
VLHEGTGVLRVPASGKVRLGLLVVKLAELVLQHGSERGEER